MEWDRRMSESLDRWLTTPPEELWREEPDYEPVIAPCGAEVYGTPRDIDSGLRKHIDTCEDCQREQMTTEITETQAAADLDPEWPGHGLE